MIGGHLGESLMALGFVTREELEALADEWPIAPRSIDETGLSLHFLVDFMLRALYSFGAQDMPSISRATKLSMGVVKELFAYLHKRAMVEIRGGASEFVWKYDLTSEGRAKALLALEQSEYVGPAPVPLEEFSDQVEKQSVAYERIDAERLEQALAHLVLPSSLVRQLGSAINSGRAVLVYGGSGNGKSSIAHALGQVFSTNILIPYCISVDGHIIKLFDPALHEAIPETPPPDSSSLSTQPDRRWIRCRRPVVHAGGELTLGMLDLDFDSISKTYEAPVQFKATCGVFIIDDFGRQLVKPSDLLNRWIVPLEKKVDYLTLHTGRKFQIPFDENVLFSTNIPPGELMDGALLRRIDYKLFVEAPSLSDYRIIFKRICAVNNLEYSEDLMPPLEDFYRETGLKVAAYHPKALVEHVLAACKFAGKHPHLSHEMLLEAMQHLLVKDSF